jgi:hypothetical protein
MMRTIKKFPSYQAAKQAVRNRVENRLKNTRVFKRAQNIKSRLKKNARRAEKRITGAALGLGGAYIGAKDFLRELEQDIAGGPEYLSGIVDSIWDAVATAENSIKPITDEVLEAVWNEATVLQNAIENSEVALAERDVINLLQPEDPLLEDIWYSLKAMPETLITEYPSIGELINVAKYGAMIAEF